MSLGPLMFSIAGTEVTEEERSWLRHPAVGGVILFTRNFESREQLVDLVAQIRGVRTPPLLVAVDQEGGRVQRFRDSFVGLPPMRTLGHLYDRNQDLAVRTAHAFAWVMAAELRACKVDLSFAPVVDVDRGLAPVIGDRAIHESAAVVGRLATAFMQGARAAGMHITAKHYPTHAGAVIDSHRAVAYDRRSYDDLLDDLVPYRQLIEHGLRAIMIAHVVFPDLDPLPASFSEWWIGRQLRSELGFDGAVISDDVDMAGAADIGTHAERVGAALAAGCDLVLLCNAPDAVPAALESLDGYSNPASQHRLSRIRGETAADRDSLHRSDDWQAALALIDRLREQPALELRG